MSSDEIEPYVHLIGPQGAQLAHGGRVDPEGPAEIVHVAPLDGTYQVYANTVEGGARGAYELRIVVEPPPRAAPLRAAPQR